jgi:hypothetical protein
MSYRIIQLEKSRESFGSYEYNIFKDDRLVAKCWHDYRGDEHGIEFKNGSRKAWPVGRMIDFIEGGGSVPLSLSAKAIVYLDEHEK